LHVAVAVPDALLLQGPAAAVGSASTSDSDHRLRCIRTGVPQGIGTGARSAHGTAQAETGRARVLARAALLGRPSLAGRSLPATAAVAVAVAVVAVVGVPAVHATPRFAPSDTDGNGRSDIALFRPSTGTWYVRGSSPIRWGQNGDIPVQAHYRGLAEPTVVAVWRPSTGGWWFDDYRLGQGNPLRYGVRGDVPAHYFGTSYDDEGVWRPSTGQWWVLGRSTPVQWGQNGDVPLPADYTGAGRADLAVWRPSTGTWRIRGIATVTYGTSSDIPISAAPTHG
jgi:hypothetical protein